MNNKVAVAGLWHLGLVSAAALADMGYEATGFEPDAEKIAKLNRAELPLFEPGLEELVKKDLSKKALKFTADAKEAVSGVSVVLLTYDTPVDDQDQIDLTLLEKTLDLLIPHMAQDSLLLINSQIPVGTAEKWQELLDERRAGAGIDLVYSPENLRLGNAIELFKNPDMVVIGSNSEKAKAKAEKFFAGFSSEKIFVSWRTAEMAKHALNAFFATSISFANELGNLCDAIGADGMEIAKILKKDSRIGKKAQVRPGLGFAGATLARDLRALQKLGKKTGVSTQLTDQVYKINQDQTGKVVEKLEAWFGGKLSGKTLAVFGLTYKPGTSTLRRSSSLEIMEKLKAKGVKLKTHDPKADLKEYRGEKYFEHFPDAFEASRGVDGILLLTEWPEYRDLDWAKIKSLMGSSKLLMDAKNHLESKKMISLGFDYLEIGRGQLKRSVTL